LYSGKRNFLKKSSEVRPVSLYTEGSGRDRLEVRCHLVPQGSLVAVSRRAQVSGKRRTTLAFGKPRRGKGRSYLQESTLGNILNRFRLESFEMGASGYRKEKLVNVSPECAAHRADGSSARKGNGEKRKKTGSCKDLWVKLYQGGRRRSSVLGKRKKREGKGGNRSGFGLPLFTIEEVLGR